MVRKGSPVRVRKRALRVPGRHAISGAIWPGSLIAVWPSVPSAWSAGQGQGMFRGPVGARRPAAAPPPLRVAGGFGLPGAWTPSRQSSAPALTWGSALARTSSDQRRRPTIDRLHHPHTTRTRALGLRAVHRVASCVGRVERPLRTLPRRDLRRGHDNRRVLPGVNDGTGTVALTSSVTTIDSRPAPGRLTVTCC
jgi:hypothetical protein